MYGCIFTHNSKYTQIWPKYCQDDASNRDNIADIATVTAVGTVLPSSDQTRPSTNFPKAVPAVNLHCAAKSIQGIGRSIFFSVSLKSELTLIAMEHHHW